MFRSHLAAKVAVGFLVTASSCVKNPATANPEFLVVNKADEIAVGKQSAGEVLKSVGPYASPDLQAYVSDVGLRIAKTTVRPDLPWGFQVVDDPSINAFALPGGQVLLTRGLLTQLTSEAELALAMGHQCAHVAALHAVAMMRRVALADLGLSIGNVAIPGVQNFDGAFGPGLELVSLTYSRNDEKVADDLAYRYALALGYDTGAVNDLLRTVDAAGIVKRGRLPEWLAIHPSPSKKAQGVDTTLASLGVGDWDPRVRGAERYLQHVDGMVFGPDPRQGYLRGLTFVQPEHRFRIDFPKGWEVGNRRDSVIAKSPRGDAAIALGFGPAMTPEQAYAEFFSSPTVREPTVPDHNRRTGVPRYFQTRTPSGNIAGVVSFFTLGHRTMELVAYSDVGRLAAYDGVFRNAFGSFAPVTDPELLDVEVRRIEVASVPGDMTLNEFQRRFPSVVPTAELAMLNGTEADSPLVPGQLVKRVIAVPTKAAPDERASADAP